MRTWIHAIGLGVVHITFLCGCGVFGVPGSATTAVIEWAEANEETDPCRINAMKHCVAASAAADQCGAPCALLLGTLVEIVQLDGDPMDYHNNRAGAEQCAEPIAGASDGAVDCCENLLDMDPSALRTDGDCE